MSDELNDPTTFTAAMAADPSTPINVLAMMANQRPDLHAALAANPAAPADLVAWLSSLGNPEISAAIAARAVTSASPVGSPTPQAAPVPPAQAAAASVAESAAWSQPVPPAPTTDWAVQPPGAPSAATPVMSAPTGSPQAGPPQVANGFSQVPPPFNEAPDAVSPKRSRAGVWIGIAAAGALILGGGAFAATKLLKTDSGGTSSPASATTNLLDALASNDMTKALKAVSPAESSYSTQLTKIVTQHLASVDGLKDLTTSGNASEVADLYSIKSEGLKLSSEDLADSSTARVTIDDAVMTVSVDADQVVTLVKKYSDSVSGLSKSMMGSMSSMMGTSDAGTDTFDATAEADLRKEIKDSFPAVITVAGGKASVKTPSVSSAKDIPVALSAIAVKEDGSWFVSPLLTFADYALSASNVTARGSLANVGDVKGAGSAQEAGTAFFAAIEKTTTSGDLGSLEAVLPLAERRLVAFLEPIYGTDEVKAAVKTASGLSLSGATFKERDSSDGVARLELTGLKIGITTQGVTVNGEWKDGCLSADILAQLGGKTTYCLSDPEFAGLKELGVDQLSFVAVKESNGWFLSLPASAADAVGVMAAKITPLLSSGKFSDQTWLEDNFGGLASLFGSSTASSDLSGLGGLSGLSGTDTSPSSDDTSADPAPSTDPSTPAATGGGSLEAELQKASAALVGYVKDHPKTAWPDLASMKKYGYEPNDSLLVVVSDYKSAKDYCLGGYDMTTFEMSSLDAAGKLFTNSTTCGS